MAAPLSAELEILLMRAIERRQGTQRMLATFLLGLGLCATIMFVAEAGLVGVPVGLVALAPGLVLWRVASMAPLETKVAVALRDRRDAIVWLWAQPNLNGVSVCFEDHAFFVVPATAGEVSGLLAALRAWAPQATVGSSDELRARYRADPGSLRRSV